MLVGGCEGGFFFSLGLVYDVKRNKAEKEEE
jgi:hypothetical protein